MAVDHSAMTDQLGDEKELAIETKLKAQRVVAGNSIDAEDCLNLLKALGLSPDQLKEELCTTPMGTLSKK